MAGQQGTLWYLYKGVLGLRLLLRTCRRTSAAPHRYMRVEHLPGLSPDRDLHWQNATGCPESGLGPATADPHPSTDLSGARLTDHRAE